MEPDENEMLTEYNNDEVDDGEVEIDSYHWHEALDRTHVSLDTFFEHVEKHPVIQQTPELKILATKVTEAKMELYQAIGKEICKDQFDGE